MTSDVGGHLQATTGEGVGSYVQAGREDNALDHNELIIGR